MKQKHMYDSGPGFSKVLHRFLLPSLLLIGLVISACSGGGCDASSAPQPPVLVSVTQDPVTLRVTAVVRDQSNNEQWFALERAYFTTANQTVVVGTSVELPDRESLPLNRDTDRTVEIVDRGVTPDEVLETGVVHSYRVRAWNCHYTSEASNTINITGL